jgi:hypothetical protein
MRNTDGHSEGKGGTEKGKRRTNAHSHSHSHARPHHHGLCPWASPKTDVARGRGGRGHPRPMLSCGDCCHPPHISKPLCRDKAQLSTPPPSQKAARTGVPAPMGWAAWAGITNRPGERGGGAWEPGMSEWTEGQQVQYHYPEACPTVYKDVEICEFGIVCIASAGRHRRDLMHLLSRTCIWGIYCSHLPPEILTDTNPPTPGSLPRQTIRLDTSMPTACPPGSGPVGDFTCAVLDGSSRRLGLGPAGINTISLCSGSRTKMPHGRTRTEGTGRTVRLLLPKEVQHLEVQHQVLDP